VQHRSDDFSRGPLGGSQEHDGEASARCLTAIVINPFLKTHGLLPAARLGGAVLLFPLLTRVAHQVTDSRLRTIDWLAASDVYPCRAYFCRGLDHQSWADDD